MQTYYKFQLTKFTRKVDLEKPISLDFGKIFMELTPEKKFILIQTEITPELILQKFKEQGIVKLNKDVNTVSLETAINAIIGKVPEVGDQPKQEEPVPQQNTNYKHQVNYTKTGTAIKKIEIIFDEEIQESAFGCNLKYRIGEETYVFQYGTVKK